MQQIIKTPGFSILLKLYHQIQDDNYIGLVKHGADSDWASIVKEGKFYSDRRGYRSKVDGDLFIKKLDYREKYEFPPARFANALKLYNSHNRLLSSHFAEPIGVIYEGDLSTIAMREGSSYHLSKYIEGKPFFELVSKDKKADIIVFREVHRVLRELRDDHIFLLDFAPRDIVIIPNIFNSKYSHPVFLDTEHVEYDLGIASREFIEGTKKLIKKQREQFKEDYGPFYSARDLEGIVEVVFPSSVGG